MVVLGEMEGQGGADRGGCKATIPHRDLAIMPDQDGLSMLVKLGPTRGLNGQLVRGAMRGGQSLLSRPANGSFEFEVSAMAQSRAACDAEW